jgi:hypothetical protein
MPCFGSGLTTFLTTFKIRSTKKHRLNPCCFTNKKAADIQRLFYLRNPHMHGARPLESFTVISRIAASHKHLSFDV